MGTQRQGSSEERPGEAAGGSTECELRIQASPPRDPLSYQTSLTKHKFKIFNNLRYVSYEEFQKHIPSHWSCAHEADSGPILTTTFILHMRELMAKVMMLGREGEH